MRVDGWTKKTLSDLAIVERGKFSVRPRNDPRYFGGQMPFVQTGDVTAARTYLKKYSQTLNAKGIEVSKIFPTETILITIAANIGDTAITQFEVACPDSVVAILPIAKVADVYWLKQVMETKKDGLDALATQNAQKNINLQVLRPLSILTPPYIEQKKIAQILSTWDKAIATTEKLLANSQQQKKALMQQLLTGKKRLLDKDGVLEVRNGFAQSKLGPLPSDWSVDLIEDHLWFQEGPGVRKHQFKENGVKLFNGTNIQFNQINLENTSTYISDDEANGVYRHFLIDDGDLVIACSGISVDRFDEKIATINSAHLPLCMNTSTMRFKVKETGLINIDYFRYFMQSWLFKNQIRRQATGSAQLNFGPSHIEKCFVAVPTLEEQIRIARILSGAEQDIAKIKSSIIMLREQKKALMQQLLTGKRRVKTDEVPA